MLGSQECVPRRAGERAASGTGGMAVLAKREEMTDGRDNTKGNSAELGDSLATRVRL